MGELIEDARDGPGDARPHEDVGDSSEHGAVDGGQVWSLDLLQEIDPDQPVVAFLCEKDLDEIGRYQKLLQLARVLLADRWLGFERFVVGLAALDEIAVENVLGDVGDRKVFKCPSHVAAGVANLEAPCQDHVQRGA